MGIKIKLSNTDLKIVIFLFSLSKNIMQNPQKVLRKKSCFNQTSIDINHVLLVCYNRRDDGFIGHCMFPSKLIMGHSQRTGSSASRCIRVQESCDLAL